MRMVKIICYVIAGIILIYGMLVTAVDILVFVYTFNNPYFIQGLPIGWIYLIIGLIGIWLTKSRIKDKKGIKEVN